MPHALLIHPVVGENSPFWWIVLAVVVLVAAGVLYLAVRLAARIFGRGKR